MKSRGFFGGVGDVTRFVDEDYANGPLQLYEIELDLKLVSATVEPSTGPRLEYY